MDSKLFKKTMCRLLYYFLCYFSKHSIDVGPYSIVAPNMHTGLERQPNTESTKNTYNLMGVGCIPSHAELSMSTVDHTENLSTNLVFLTVTLSQHLLISLSIFDTWGHMRLQDTTNATRPFTVDIVPSRVVRSAEIVFWSLVTL